MKNSRTIFAYPWDLHDEGIDASLEVIEKTGRFDEVCVALSYHIATYFLPHNPVRKLYYGDHGAVRPRCRATTVPCISTPI